MRAYRSCHCQAPGRWDVFHVQEEGSRCCDPRNIKAEGKKHGRVRSPEGIRYSAKRGSLDSDSPEAKCASANEWLCSPGRLDDDGDDDEFMTMIISGGVPLCRHRCLSFRRGDSGVKKRPGNDGMSLVRGRLRIVLATGVDTPRTTLTN